MPSMQDAKKRTSSRSIAINRMVQGTWHRHQKAGLSPLNELACSQTADVIPHRDAGLYCSDLFQALWNNSDSKTRQTKTATSPRKLAKAWTLKMTDNLAEGLLQ